MYGNIALHGMGRHLWRRFYECSLTEYGRSKINQEQYSLFFAGNRNDSTVLDALCDGRRK